MSTTLPSDHPITIEEVKDPASPWYERPGGYDPPDDPPDFPPEFGCRRCGEFNELHEEQETCGECQDAIDNS